MSFFTEMQAVAAELLGPGPDSLGEDAIVRRPGSGYDKATRRATTGDELAMHMRGTFSPSGPMEDNLAAAGQAASLISRFERAFLGFPALQAGETEFEPTVGDQIEGDGHTWNIEAVSTERRQGVLLFYNMGLSRA